MNKKTIYDLLEVSSTASTEAIEASYARLLASITTSGMASNMADIRIAALKDARAKLVDPNQRREYDRRVFGFPSGQDAAPDSFVMEDQPFWSMTKIFVIGFLILVAAIVWKQYDRVETRKRIAEQERLAKVTAEENKRHAAEVDAKLIQQQLDIERRQTEIVNQYATQRARLEGQVVGAALAASEKRIAAENQREKQARERTEQAQVERELYEAKRRAAEDENRLRRLQSMNR